MWTLVYSCLTLLNETIMYEFLWSDYYIILDKDINFLSQNVYCTVSEIHELTQPMLWRRVRSHKKPVVLQELYQSLKEIAIYNLWWNGPSGCRYLLHTNGLTKTHFTNIAIVYEENATPLSWDIARIMSISLRKDNVLRVVYLKTQHYSLTRSIIKVYIHIN